MALVIRSSPGVGAVDDHGTTAVVSGRPYRRGDACVAQPGDPTAPAGDACVAPTSTVGPCDEQGAASSEGVLGIAGEVRMTTDHFSRVYARQEYLTPGGPETLAFIADAIRAGGRA